MPKLVPMPVIVDLLDDGPVIKLVIEHRLNKKGKSGCAKCIGRDRSSCSSIVAAAGARGEKNCTWKNESYYVLRPLKKSEVR